MSRVGELKAKVKYILDKFPDTRNSDIGLTIAIWKFYHPNKILKREADGKLYVCLDDLFGLEREDNIKRIRAQFNADGLFLPTSLEVAKARGMKEEDWRRALGYGTSLDSQE